jgi:hypothetical protein
MPFLEGGKYYISLDIIFEENSAELVYATFGRVLYIIRNHFLRRIQQ